MAASAVITVGVTASVSMLTGTTRFLSRATCRSSRPPAWSGRALLARWHRMGAIFGHFGGCRFHGGLAGFGGRRFDCRFGGQIKRGYRGTARQRGVFLGDGIFQWRWRWGGASALSPETRRRSWMRPWRRERLAGQARTTAANPSQRRGRRRGGRCRSGIRRCCRDRLIGFGRRLILVAGLGAFLDFLAGFRACRPGVGRGWRFAPPPPPPAAPSAPSARSRTSSSVSDVATISSGFSSGTTAGLATGVGWGREILDR